MVSCDKSDEFTVAFYLYGEENVTVDYGSTYIDEGAYLNIIGTELSDELKINNTLDTNNLGTYTIDYFYNEMIITRTVTVADTSPPVITLNDDKTKYMNVSDTFTYPVFTAVDNYDGDITHLVETANTIISDTEGEYKAVYTVTDSSGNSASIEQTIIVENSMLSTSADEFTIDGMYPDTVLPEQILSETEINEYIKDTIFIGDSRSCHFIWYDFISSANGWGTQSLTPLNINTLKIHKFFTKEIDLAINLITDFQPKTNHIHYGRRLYRFI